MSDTPRPLRVDFQKCIKAGECYYNHPDLFMMSESGFPAVRIRHPSTTTQTREAREAVEVCPSGAITYEHDHQA
jgi:ferredoxin